MSRATGLALYDEAARVSAAPVIRLYSTSFRLATALFPRRCRGAVASIYALVRIADEIVDGTATEAGLAVVEQRRRLDELELETESALTTGFSANLVVHAFAGAAREAAIGPELTRAFFASMRRDLEAVDFDEREYRTYIHGSAEVVGLMCLRVFLTGEDVDDTRRGELDAGAARLGAAFQKVNFLRDLGDDGARLGRSYLPALTTTRMTDAEKSAVVAEVRADLDAARPAIGMLPRDVRRAVLVAADLFRELLDRIERLPAERLPEVRVSVPTRVKLAIALRRLLLPRGAHR